MGFEPGLSTYDSKGDCANAKPFFNFEPQPERILVTILGLTRCPAYVGPDPSSSGILTTPLFGDECGWGFIDGLFLWTFRFVPGPAFDINQFFGPLTAAFFGAGPTDRIPNQLLCGFPPISHTGGEAIISWGPNI